MPTPLPYLEKESRWRCSGAYLVVPKNLLELLLRNAHPNAIGAVHYEYDGMDVAVDGYKTNG